MSIVRPFGTTCGVTQQSAGLVCGQGRLEAFIALAASEIPAIIVEAREKDCFVISPVENLARRQLLELVERHDITLIEDDCDHEYRFEGRPVLPLAARAPADLSLIYVGSLSNLFSPGIRLGYAMAPEPLSGRILPPRTGDRPAGRYTV
ncbi:MAG: hypothetical protein AB7D33_11680 [Sphingobium sp.]